MLVACPSCEQSFEVPDGAITEKGRKLKCSQCAHKWHQTPVSEEEQEKIRKRKAQKIANATDDDPADGTAGADAGDMDGGGEVDLADTGGGGRKPRIPGTDGDEAAGDGADGDDFDFSAGIDDDLGFPTLPDRGRGADKGPGKPRRLMLKAIVGLVLFIIVTGGGAVLARDALVSAWPPSALLFDRIGLHVPVPGEGLVIQNVRTFKRTDGQVEVLVVQGELFNRTDKMHTLPGLVGQILDGQGAVAEEWLFSTEQQIILPDETVSFENLYAYPPEEAAGVLLTFTLKKPEAGLGY